MKRWREWTPEEELRETARAARSFMNIVRCHDCGLPEVNRYQAHPIVADEDYELRPETPHLDIVVGILAALFLLGLWVALGAKA